MKKINLRRKSLIIAALLAAVSVGAGTAGTVAFFQSNHSFDIAVEAAKVDVEQEKPVLVSTTAAYGEVTVNDDGSVSATKLTPGDSFLLKVSYVNKSNIGIKYRISAVTPTGYVAGFFTDEDCTTEATDTTAYTELANGGTIADHYVQVTATDDLEQGSSDKITIGVDAVQDNVDTSTLFGKELEAGGTVKLTEDLSVINPADSVFTVRQDTVIDLNGKALTLDAQDSSTALSVEDGKTLTLKNGTVEVTGNRPDKALLQAINSNLVLDGVTYSAATGTAITYEGNGSNITIKDSHISVENGYYALATNANTSLGDQSDSSVTITGSTLSVTNSRTGEEGDCAAVYLNVGGKYSISDSNITGQRFGALIRSGDLTLNNVTINKTETVDLDYVKKADSGTFSSGTEVAQGALFLGNGSSGNYTAPSRVTFAGPVTFGGVGPAIVASGSTTQDVDLETGTYYTGDVKVYDFRAEGDTHTFKINGNDIAIGTYGHDGKGVYTIK